MRQKLPGRRPNVTTKVQLKGVRRSVFVTLGYDTGGKIIEVFISCGREGEFITAIMASLGMTISLALQCGAPIEKIVKIVSGYSEDTVPWAVWKVLTEEINDNSNIPSSGL